MSKMVWKYQLAMSGEVQEIDMPKRAHVLCVQLQHDVPCIWALVDPHNMMETRKVIIVGTGHAAPDNVDEYVGTFQLHGGALVFHVFAENHVR